MNTEQCLFCNHAEAYRKNLSLLLPELEDPVVLKNKDFLVIPDTFPLVAYPWYLIIPKQHMTAGVDISDTESYERLLQSVIDYSGENQFIMFEHGERITGGEEIGKMKAKSVTHQHTHLLATGYTTILSGIEQRMKEWGLSPRPISFNHLEPYTDLISYVNGQSYLYIREGNNGLFYIEHENEPIPSQIFRRLLAESFNEPFVDWKNLKEGERSIIQNRLAMLYL